jgi:RecT family protein
MSELERVHAAPPITVDIDALKYLGLDPENVATRALVLLAQRYQLDPLLGEIQLIEGKKGRQIYISRDGMLAVAHASGQLDGIVVDEQRRNSTGDGFTAYVSVWRKDMSHPFRYGAQCKDTERQAREGHGAEQALARAERRALKRAFRIRTDFYPERPDIEDIDAIEAEATEATDTSPPNGGAEAAREVSITRPPASPPRYEDEFIVPTFDQTNELRGLIVDLGLAGDSMRHERLALFGRLVGHVVADTRLLDRGETQTIIDALRGELEEMQEAQRQAAREIEARSLLQVEPDAEDDGYR